MELQDNNENSVTLSAANIQIIYLLFIYKLIYKI